VVTRTTGGTGPSTMVADGAGVATLGPAGSTGDAGDISAGAVTVTSAAGARVDAVEEAPDGTGRGVDGGATVDGGASGATGDASARSGCAVAGAAGGTAARNASGPRLTRENTATLMNRTWAATAA